MMWVLLVGSLPQSLAKHTMEAPSSTGGLVRPRRGEMGVSVIGEFVLDRPHQSLAALWFAGGTSSLTSMPIFAAAQRSTFRTTW